MPLHWATTENLIAAYSRASARQLQALAASRDVRTRRLVAANPGAPLEALRDLADDVDEDVRANVAQNANTTASVLQGMCADGSARVRLAVAKHDKVDLDAVETLCADDHLAVSAAAVRALTRLEALVVVQAVLREREDAARTEEARDALLAHEAALGRAPEVARGAGVAAG